MKIHPKELKFVPFVMCCLSVAEAALAFTIFPPLQKLSYLVLGLCLLSFFAMLFVYLRRPFMSFFGLSVIIFFMLLMVSSIINVNGIKTAFYLAANSWLMLILFRYYENSARLIMQAVAFAFSLCVYANILALIMFPEWVFSADNPTGAFLLGGNYNQMGSRLITCIVCNILCIRYSKWWLVNTILTLLVTLFTLLVVGSMTSLSVIIFFSLLCLIPSTKFLRICFFGWMVVFILFHIFVVFNGQSLHNNELAVYFVEDVLGKDITFSGRTFQWEAALDIISKSPIIGYGYVDEEWYIANMSSFAAGPHNFILSQWVYGGILLLMSYLVTLALGMKRLIDFKDRNASILLLGIVSLMTMLTFEYTSPYFILLLLTIANFYPQICDSYQKNEEMDEVSVSSSSPQP